MFAHKLSIGTVSLVFFLGASAGAFSQTVQPNEALLESLRMGSETERKSAGDELVRRACDDLAHVSPALVQTLKDTDSNIKFYGVSIFGASAYCSENNAKEVAKLSPSLLPLLQDEDPRIRKMTADAFALMLPSPPKDAEAPLIALLKDDSDIRVRKSALEAVSRIRPITEETFGAVVNVLDRDPSTSLQVAAINVLGEFRTFHSRVLPVLLNAMHHSDPGIREQAVSAIGELGPVIAETVPTVVIALRDIANNPDEATSVRFAAGQAVSSIIAKPPPVVIPGDVEIAIHEWNTPTSGGTHDPVVAPDGTVWWTESMNNRVGRFDPKTQQFKEYAVRTPNSVPHGLVADLNNNIWFMEVRGSYIGKLDPESGQITEYQVPEPPGGVGRRILSGESTLESHAPIFDQKGVLWFTTPQSNRVGRLDPKTGEVQTAEVPMPDPHGIVINSRGVPYYASWGTNKLGSVDPQTMRVNQHVIPFEDARARRIAVTSDGGVWYADDGRGVLGKFDPRTGEFKEYQSPSGPKSRPFGMTAVGDIVWYSETGVFPNTIVRFDPRTEKFRSWEIPSGDTVRFMTHDRAGDLWMTESDLNRITKIEVKEK